MTQQYDLSYLKCDPDDAIELNVVGIVVADDHDVVQYYCNAVDVVDPVGPSIGDAVILH